MKSATVTENTINARVNHLPSKGVRDTNCEWSCYLDHIGNRSLWGWSDSRVCTASDAGCEDGVLPRAGAAEATTNTTIPRVRYMLAILELEIANG